MAKYQSIQLDAEPAERKHHPLKVALLLVSVAGCAALIGGTVLSAPMAATNAGYDANDVDNSVLNCDRNSDTFHLDAPKWDPDYNTVKDFYNACYFAFRCCTTTGNGNGCYVSNNFGSSCKGCLANNGPLQVRLPCKMWLNDEVYDTSSWGEADLLSDNGVPETDIIRYAVNFNTLPPNKKSCWAAGTRNTYEEFADKCFEVLNWCNLLCPRDTPQTVDHVMCKHCALNGFSDNYFDAANFEDGLGRTDITDAEQAAISSVGEA